MLKYDECRSNLTYDFMRFWVDSYVQIDDPVRRQAFMNLVEVYGFEGVFEHRDAVHVKNDQ